MTVRWKRSPQEYFEFGTPDAYVVQRLPCVVSSTPQSWTVNVDKDRCLLYTSFDDLTYEDISEITKTSVGALKASYHHAVAKIEKILNGED